MKRREIREKEGEGGGEAGRVIVGDVSELIVGGLFFLLTAILLDMAVAIPVEYETDRKTHLKLVLGEATKKRKSVQKKVGIILRFESNRITDIPQLPQGGTTQLTGSTSGHIKEGTTVATIGKGTVNTDKTVIIRMILTRPRLTKT